MDQIKIQIRYSIGDFNDALYFTPDEWNANPDIEAMKKERYEAHLNSIKNPPVRPEPTEEELIEEAKNINQQIQELVSRKDDIAEIVDLPPEILNGESLP